MTFTGAMGFSAIASAVSFSILGRTRPSRISTAPDGERLIRTPPFWFFSRLAVLPVGEAVILRHRDPCRAGLVVLPQFLDRFLLQGEELLGIVKVGSLVLGKEVGRDGARVFLGREYRQSHGRAIIQQRGPDLVGAVIAAAAICSTMRVCASSLPKVRDSACESVITPFVNAALASRHRLLSARRRLIVVALNPVCATTSSRVTPL